MSFFDETKNFGLVLMIVSIVGIILAAFMMFVGINDTKMTVLAGVGSIVGDLIILIYAFGVYQGDYLIPIDRYIDDAKTKYGVLTGFVSVSAISNVVDAIFSFIGGSVSGGITAIVIAVLCFLMAYFMTDGQKNVADNIIFIVLAIVFILMIIGGILSLIILVGIIPLIEGIMLLVMLFSPEVKGKMWD